MAFAGERAGVRLGYGDGGLWALLMAFVGRRRPGTARRSEGDSPLLDAAFELVDVGSAEGAFNGPSAEVVFATLDRGSVLGQKGRF